ncbi:MAG: anaerobic ribonucleoside-triphosphate reductase [Holosporales bacterium]|jgi:hypothetical protein|nr:anaerobic ribonucleoside-triphosphate reductase [Holosporales bacterium]
MMENNKIELRDEERTVCEVWTRVMGYFRPVTTFNNGKKSEYDDRICFVEKTCENCHISD